MTNKFARGISKHAIIIVWMIFMIGVSINTIIQLVTYQNKMDSVNGFVFQGAIVTVTFYLLWVWKNRRRSSISKINISGLILIFGALMTALPLHIFAIKYTMLIFLMASVCWIVAFWLAIKGSRKKKEKD
ncbi:MAG: hypothetical protein ABF490_13300 [Lentilactobacillus hilgardii]|uniref:hypothetical protein n=3 Tax=Lentilactobacillus hilgardii TaxID=1588 RepID=UPI001CC1FE8E|nr:hypothetical protein [Lentilactobacillus hilgardii]